MTDDIPIPSQPWCEMQFNGRFIQYPNPKDIIWIILQGGDIFHPIYLGTTYAPVGSNGNHELRYVQSHIKDTKFEGEFTHAPNLKLKPLDGKARDWWLETTIKSFAPSYDTGSGKASPGVGSGENELVNKNQLAIDDGHNITLEMDSHIGSERFQINFLEGDGYLTFSKHHFNGLEIYTNGTYNLEARNKYGGLPVEYENRIRHKDSGWEVWSDKRHWIHSEKETDIQSENHLHLECKSGEVNVQAIDGGAFLRSNGGKAHVTGSKGIIIGPDSASGNADTHAGEAIQEGLYSFPMLGGDGKLYKPS